MGLIVANCISKDSYKIFLDSMIKSLKLKRDLICDILDLFPDVFSYEIPDGGYFVFVKINDTYKIDSNEFLKICSSNGITFHQGWKFTSDELKDKYKKYFRLSCSYYDHSTLLDLLETRMKICVTHIRRESLIWEFGHRGRLGSLICSELKERMFEYNIIDRSFGLRAIINEDLIVDVSSPEGTETLLTKLFEKNIFPTIIVGTTGNLPMDLINSYPGKIIVRSNFSEGIPLVLSLLDKFDKNIWKKIEIKDYHHVNKKDSPSGTAKTIKSQLILNGFNNDNIEINSYREGDIIGTHDIIISNDVESITIQHKALNRKIFAVGCVNLIQKYMN